MKRAASAVLRPLKVPPVERHTLSNGLETHLVRRGSLPLVAVRLVIAGGSAFDTAGKLGVADFAARLMRRGAGGKTADELSETVEFVGASVSGYANEENVVISLSTPARHLEQMLEVLATITMAPDFAEKEVELSRRRTLAQIANELDDPGALADRALVRALWGDHPYGHETVGLVKDLTALTRADLQAFHRERLGPRVSHLFMVGDIDPARITPLVERTFGRWQGGPQAAPRLPEWKGLPRPGSVIIVDKPDQTQVQMRVGARGVKRGHPDHFPLVVMNSVLGGGFTSRLVTEVRVKRGLSYGAGCGYDMLSAGGTFSASSFTRTETVHTLLDVTLGEIDKMRKKGPSAAELATAQRYICGLYPGRLETNEAISGALADVALYNLAPDWVSTYREHIAQVDQRRAAKAAAEHLFEGKDRVVVLCGNAEAVRPLVEKYGAVEVLKPAELS